MPRGAASEPIIPQQPWDYPRSCSALQLRKVAVSSRIQHLASTEAPLLVGMGCFTAAAASSRVVTSHQ